MVMPRKATLTEVKPYSIKELALLYGVCDKTLKKWLKPFAETIGTKQGRYYNVAQVSIIFDKLGLPITVENG
jgi:transposase-like protein